MAHLNSFTLITVSVLLVIPLFCEGVVKRDTENEDSSSGEAEVVREHKRVGLSGSSDRGTEEEQDRGTEEEQTGSQEDAADPSTSSPAAAVGKETNHLPLDPDEETTEEEKHETEEESVDSTTFPSDPSSDAPLAPIPSEEEEVVRKDTSSQQSQALQPTDEESLSARPSETVIIWDGTGEPEREHTVAENDAASQPEQSDSQQDQPTSQPKHLAGQPKEPGNQPHSEELHGGANGNGQSQAPASDSVDKSSLDERKEEVDGADAKAVSDTASGSTSSPMTWVVVFAVVSSALLISGWGDSEVDRESSSCHRGCWHNFTDFNPYAWPPTPVNRNGVTLRPVT